MSIKVPQYQQQVSVSPVSVPTPNIPMPKQPTPPREAFGESVYRANAELGEVGQKIGQAIAKRAEEKYQLEQDQIESDTYLDFQRNKQDRLLSDEMEEINGVERKKGLLNRQLSSASGVTQDYQTWADKTVPEYLNRIQDPNTKAKLSNRLKIDALSTRETVIKHEQAQWRQDKENSFKSEIAMAKDNAFTVRTPEELAIQVNNAVVGQDKMNRLLSLDDTTSQLGLKSAVSDVVDNAVMGALGTDKTGATSRALLNASALLDAKTRVDLEKKLDTAMKENATVKIAELDDRIVNDEPLDDIIVEIMSLNKPIEDGGIGATKARAKLKDISEIQANRLNKLKEGMDREDLADKYIDKVDKLLSGSFDNFQAKQILVDAMVDGLDSGEVRDLKKLEGGGIKGAVNAVERFFNQNNPSGNVKLADSIKQLLADPNVEQSPEKVAEKVSRQAYNEIYPEVPLSEDEKVVDPTRERQLYTTPLLRKIGKGFGAGVAGMVEGTGGALEMSKNKFLKGVGEKVSAYADEMKDFYAVPDADFLYKVSAGFGSMSTFFLPGLGVARGVNALTAFPRLASWLGVSASAYLESTVEGGVAYKEAIERGIPEKEAVGMGSAVFWANLPVVALTNKFGIFSEAKGLKGFVGSAINEGFVQEGSQQIIGNIVNNDEILQGYLESAVIGAIVGGGTKVAVDALAPLKDIDAGKELKDRLAAVKGPDIKGEKGSVINPFVTDKSGKPIVLGDLNTAIEAEAPLILSGKEATAFLEKQGVTAKAMKESGLGEFLDSKDRFGKQEIVDFLNKDAVEVDDNVEGTGTPPDDKVGDAVESSEEEFKGLPDKELVSQLSDFVSNFEPGQTVIDFEGNYSRMSSSFLPEFSNKGYTQKYLQNIYSKYSNNEALTPKQTEDLVYTLNVFKKMFGIPTSENIPDAVTADDIRNSKANIVLVNKLGKALSRGVPSEKVKGVVREQTGQVKDQGENISERTAFIQSLKDRVKAASQARTATREEIFDIQSGLVELVSNSQLETDDKSKFLKTIKNIQTQEDFNKALPEISQRIIDLENREQRRALVGELKDTTKRMKDSKNVAVDYANAIEAITDTVDLTERTPQTLERLAKAEAFFKSQIAQGKDVEIPKKLMSKLELLNKKGVEELSNKELQSMLDEVQKLEQLGQTKLRVRQELNTSKKAKDLQDIKADSSPVSSKEITKAVPGERLGAMETFKNNIKEKFNFIQEKNLSISPMDVIFDLLDGNKDYRGANYKIFKERADVAYSKFLDMKQSLQKEVIDLSVELGISEQNLERIGVYAASQQEGGMEKLADTGITEQQVNAIKLTDSEMKVYNAMRSALDSLRPEIAEVMRVVYNEELGDVKNYFSFMTDFDAMTDSEIRERFGDSVEEFGLGKRKNVAKGFTKKRVGGKQKIKINAMEVFLKHTENASYLTEMGETIKYLGELSATPEYGEAVGELGQEYVRDWVDLLARKGRAAGDRIGILDTFRKNVGMATLGFKLSSAMIQPTALFHGASLVGGGYVTQGIKDITDPDWRNFIKENFPEIRERVGDDPAYLDFGGNTLIDKSGKAAFWALQNLDLLSASAVAAGAYTKAVEAKGGVVDLSNPDQDAITEAQRIVRRTQASALFKDAPQAISRGKLTGNVSLDKLILQFQSFMLNEWSLIQHDLYRSGIKAGDYKKAVNIATWLALATFAEMGLRRMSKEMIAFMTGADVEDWDETFQKELVMNMIQKVPFVSQAVSALNYGSIPVPSIDITANMLEKFYLSATAKKQDTKTRNFIRGTLLALGIFKGIPGVIQTEQIAKDVLKDNKKSKKVKPVNF